MKTKATVVATDGDFATVETERTSACEGCHKMTDGKGCSVCSLMGSERTVTARAINRVGARTGDVVTVESSTGRVIGYAGLVFLLPLAIALICYTVVSALTDSAAWQAVGAVSGLALTFVGLYLYSRALQKKRCDIEVTEILRSGSDR